MEAFTVLVADASQTPQSLAVLDCLWRWARPRDGRTLDILIDPSLATVDPNAAPIRGAKAVILLLLARQPRAAERLRSFWNTVTAAQQSDVPVLPILISDDDTEATPLLLGGTLPDSAISRRLRPLVLHEDDIQVEHGGRFDLATVAEARLREALTSLSRPVVAAGQAA